MTEAPLCTYCVPGTLLGAENITVMEINMVSDITDIHKLIGQKHKLIIATQALIFEKIQLKKKKRPLLLTEVWFEDKCSSRRSSKC